MRIPFLKKEGYEADDIIGTLATQAKAAGFETLICSGDRDSFQLVDDDTTVIYPMRGVSEMKRMTPAAVEERYGVPPARYPELAALVGETSDNLPGVPGCRPGLRREVDQPVRRPRQRDRARRRDHRQEGRGAARAPRRRDAQPSPQRAGVRPRARGDPAGPRLGHLGPAGRAHALRRAGVPGAPHPAARGDPHRGGRRRRVRVRRQHAGARHGRAGGLAGRAHRTTASGSACTPSATGGPAPATSPRWPSRPRTARPTSRPTRPTRPTSRPWRPGSPTRRCPR